MKINIEIDATPEEMRRALGLPNVQPLQEELMEKMAEKFRTAMDTTDPAKMLAPFLPDGMRSMEDWQKAFWSTVAGQRKD